MKSTAVARKRGAAIVPAALAINEAHREALSAVAAATMTGIDRIVTVGKLLAEEKAKHKHGEWIPWIESNLDFGRKQAAKYLRAYEMRDSLQKKLSNVPSEETFKHSINGSLRLLAKPREKPVKRRESPEASVEVEDSDDDMEEETSSGDAVNDADDDSYLAAYLIRADQAIKFAVYKGTVSRDVIAMARRVADAWTKLADQMEERS